MKKGQFQHLARPGAEFAVRVTPRAARNELRETEGGLHVRVTTVPEGGKANKAVVKLLAAALGVPKSALTLVRGETSRDKLFRLDR